MKDLKIALEDTLYVIPPAGYTFSPGRGYLQKCIVPVMATGRLQNMIILGDTFLRNFYSKYDYAQTKFSLAVSNTISWNPSIITHSKGKILEELKAMSPEEFLQ